MKQSTQRIIYTTLATLVVVLGSYAVFNKIDEQLKVKAERDDLAAKLASSDFDIARLENEITRLKRVPCTCHSRVTWNGKSCAIDKDTYPKR